MTRMIALLTMGLFAATTMSVRADEFPNTRSIEAFSTSKNEPRSLPGIVRIDDGTIYLETGQGAVSGIQIAEAGHVHEDGSPHKEDDAASGNKAASELTKSEAAPDDHKKKDGHDHSEHGHNGPKDKPEKATHEPGGHSEKGHDHGNEKTVKDDDEHGHADGGADAPGHEEHDEGVRLSKKQMDEFGVRNATIGPGQIATIIIRPAEVKFNENFVAHVFPRVSGVVQSVSASEGETVQERQVIAQLDSRELAEAKAAYLAATERYTLAKENYEREESLQRKKITSAKSLSTSKTKLGEARIALRSSDQKLRALGIDEVSISQITNSAQTDFTRYIMRAPLGGIVIERHLVRGESVKTDSKAFTIADVSTIWVDINIYPRDLPNVRAGQVVVVKTNNGQEVNGKIEFVSPHVSEATRTAKARLVLDNSNSLLKPGQFVKAEIAISKTAAAVRIPKSALQNQNGKSVVFVADAGRFETRPVEVGQQDSTYAEVVSGLKAGETVVVDGAFVIKSQLSKASFGDGHNH